MAITILPPSWSLRDKEHHERNNICKFGIGEEEQRLTGLSCGYFCHSKLEEPYDGIPPGTTFEDLPNDWTCPECGVHKGNIARSDPS